MDAFVSMIIVWLNASFQPPFDSDELGDANRAT